MKKKCLLFLIVLFPFLHSYSQENYQLNDLLAVCRKAKTETEDNGRFVITLIDKSDPKYSESMRLYNTARSSFEEWIEYYMLEVEDIINKKDKAINEQSLRKKISDALESVRAFNSYVEQIPADKNTSVARNYVPTVTEISTCFNSAVGFIKLLKDSKREKQETMKKDLTARMSRYHITEFTSLK